MSLIRNGRFEGSRLTVCHAGSAEVGLLPTATDLVSLITVQIWKLLILKDCMQTFVNHLVEGLIIILDSASYHCTIIDKTKFLTQDLIKKMEILEWLWKKNIECEPTEIIAKLLLLIAPYCSWQMMYELDRIANKPVTCVIILTSYHCQYNPLELVQAKVKRDITKLNCSFRLSNLRCMNETASNGLMQRQGLGWHYAMHCHNFSTYESGDPESSDAECEDDDGTMLHHQLFQ
jgi:hypothetical protein